MDPEWRCISYWKWAYSIAMSLGHCSRLLFRVRKATGVPKTLTIFHFFSFFLGKAQVISISWRSWLIVNWWEWDLLLKGIVFSDASKHGAHQTTNLSWVDSQGRIIPWLVSGENPWWSQVPLVDLVILWDPFTNGRTSWLINEGGIRSPLTWNMVKLHRDRKNDLVSPKR